MNPPSADPVALQALDMQAAADRCANEPIHIPGSIQPHGCLLVLDPHTLALRQASANASQLLGGNLRPGEAWPEHMPRLQALLDLLRGAVAEESTGLPGVRSLPLEGQRLDISLQRSPQGLIVELELSSRQDTDTFDALYPRIRHFVDQIERITDVRDLCAMAATQLRAITGFHRVMVYRFDPQWHGTVIAEDGDGTLPSYLDLRFPASDIPAQARALYRSNRLRLIPDAHYTPVPVLPACNPTDGQPLDLSQAALRSVSPVHLQYMRNMGTAASMSVSLLVDGELWGLISCHHAQPRVLGPQWRGACDFIGQLLAMQIAARERGAYADARLAHSAIETELLAHVSQAPSVQSGLAESPQLWLRLAGAQGAAIVKEGVILTAGRTPSLPQIEALVPWLRQRIGTEPHFATATLPVEHPEAAAYSESACGLLAIPISALHPHYILWFRPEQLQTVRWGGRPEKATAPDGTLHPRASFAQWTEELRGQAVPWSRAEVEAVESFRHAVVNFVLMRAEERAQLTERLENSNRELEAFSYSVSHDLRAPFRHVVGYAQLLQERGEGLDPRARHYLDSIIASAVAAGQLVDDLLNFSQLGRASLDLTRVDMNKLVFELRRSNELEGTDRQIRWEVASLPPAYADAAMLRQAMANLLDNALKYSRNREPAVIRIDGEDRAHETVYTVADNGVGFDMAYVGKLFGVFQRLHRAEEFEGTGIGLALVRRIIDRHGGWISAEGRLNQGAVFRIGLPKPDKDPLP